MQYINLRTIKMKIISKKNQKLPQIFAGNLLVYLGAGKYPNPQVDYLINYLIPSFYRIKK